jgi:hypothetical protein
VLFDDEWLSASAPLEFPSRLFGVRAFRASRRARCEVFARGCVTEQDIVNPTIAQQFALDFPPLHTASMFTPQHKI